MSRDVVAFTREAVEDLRRPVGRAVVDEQATFHVLPDACRASSISARSGSSASRSSKTGTTTETSTRSPGAAVEPTAGSVPARSDARRG